MITKKEEPVLVAAVYFYDMNIEQVKNATEALVAVLEEEG